MKEDDVLDVIALPSSTLFLDAANEAMAIVLDEKRSVRTVYEVEVRGPLETDEDLERQLLHGKVDLVQTNPPYNVRNKSDINSCLHDIFTPKDMSDFGQFACEVIAADAHRHVSCL